MGELSITFAIQIPGKSHTLRAELRLCANRNCTRSQEHGRESFLVEETSTKKFCGEECRNTWNNKKGRK